MQPIPAIRYANPNTKFSQPENCPVRGSCGGAGSIKA